MMCKLRARDHRVKPSELNPPVMKMEEKKNVMIDQCS